MTKICSHSTFSKVAFCRESNEKKYGRETQPKQHSSAHRKLSDLAIHTLYVPIASKEDIESRLAGTNIRPYDQIKTQYQSIKVRMKLLLQKLRPMIRIQTKTLYVWLLRTPAFMQLWVTSLIQTDLSTPDHPRTWHQIIRCFQLSTQQDHFLFERAMILMK